MASLAAASGSDVASSSKPCTGVLKVPFPNPRLAMVAFGCLQVDEEIQADKIQRDMVVEDRTLVVTFRAENTKLLRVAMSSFSDFMLVSIKTMMEFDE